MNKSIGEKKNWFEWLVFAVGCVIILVVIGGLVQQMWVDSSANGPILQLVVNAPQAMAEEFAIPVKVANIGRQAAENVRIQVVVHRPNGETENSEFDMQFLPEQSEQTGFAVFERDPADATKITARTIGFVTP